jgi:hypothetical protein
MKFRLLLLTSLLATGISLAYASRILVPWESNMDVATGSLTAHLGDLYPRWAGTRELLLHGLNPYGLEVSKKIQIAYYGHIVIQDSAGTGHIVDEQRFAYPVYVVFLMAPTINVDFDEVHRGALFALALLIVLSVFFCLNILHWSPSWQGVTALVLFTLGSPQVEQGLRLRQLGILVGFLLILATWCVTKDHLATAGLILALSTIKPQMAILPMAWFLVWSLGKWRERWRLFAGFAGGLAALVGFGEWILPGWLSYFIAGLQAYRKYVPPTSLLRLVFGEFTAYFLSGLLIVALLVAAWRRRQCPANSEQFALILSAFLVAATIALPLLPPFNQVLLLLPLILVFRNWQQLPHILRIVFALCVSWPWVASLILLLVRPDIHSTSRAPLFPFFTVVLLPFLLLPLLLVSWRSID